MSQLFLSASAFNASAGSDVMSRMLAASANTELRSKVYNATYAAAIKNGAQPSIASLKALHASSPYTLGLKYKGTPLPVDAERILEAGVIQTALRTRNAVNDLISRGKVRPLPDIGVMTDQWKRMTNQSAASVGMELSGGPTDDRQTFDVQGTPIPIIQKRFSFEMREMLAAARNGTPLDTTHANRAAEMVAEAEENMLINGQSITVGGFTVYGYRTHPNRLTDTGSSFGTPANILTTFNGATDVLRQANKFGETTFYLNGDQYTEMLVDHKTESDKTALQRALELPGVADIKYNPFVPTGEMVGVVMGSSDVDLAIAQNVTTVPWEVEGGAVQHWRVFSALAPRIMPDADGQVGVIHVTGI